MFPVSFHLGAKAKGYTPSYLVMLYSGGEQELVKLAMEVTVWNWHTLTSAHISLAKSTYIIKPNLHGMRNYLFTDQGRKSQYLLNNSTKHHMFNKRS